MPSRGGASSAASFLMEHGDRQHRRQENQPGTKVRQKTIASGRRSKNFSMSPASSEAEIQEGVETSRSPPLPSANRAKHAQGPVFRKAGSGASRARHCRSCRTSRCTAGSSARRRRRAPARRWPSYRGRRRRGRDSAWPRKCRPSCASDLARKMTQPNITQANVSMTLDHPRQTLAGIEARTACRRP